MSAAQAPPIVIAGAAMSGLRTAEQLRANGWEGGITLIGEEPHLPYNRPPLSKAALSLPGHHGIAQWHETVEFRRRASIEDVDWVLGRSVAGCDVPGRVVKLDDGETLEWSGLVAATGLRPRRLPATWPREGRMALRTLDDAVLLRSHLRPGARIVVVGAGFIGCEVAATALRLGCDVTVVEPLDSPMEAAVGRTVGRAVEAYHERNGVRFVTGHGVAGIRGASGNPDRVAGVRLDDDRELAADVVLEAMGATPATEWLDGNGLDLSDGVLCDPQLRAEGATRVVAVGDIARFSHAREPDGPRRVEHWCIPTDTAKRAAPTLVADIAGEQPRSEPFTALPSFWSDQGDLRLQAFGTTTYAATATVTEGDLDDLSGDGAVVEYSRDGRLTGVLLINRPPNTYRKLRDRVDAATRPDSEGTSR